MLSIQFVVMVAVGGLGNVYGAVVGTVAILYLEQKLREFGPRPELFGWDLPVAAPTVFSLGVFGLILIGSCCSSPAACSQRSETLSRPGVVGSARCAETVPTRARRRPPRDPVEAIPACAEAARAPAPCPGSIGGLCPLTQLTDLYCEHPRGRLRWASVGRGRRLDRRRSIDRPRESNSPDQMSAGHPVV